jgi:hypothetical protein
VKANTKTASFRIVLSVAVLWTLSISAYGLVSGEAERTLINRAVAEKCSGESQEQHGYANLPSPRELCEASAEVTYPRLDLIMLGNPLFLLAQYVLLPSLAAIGLTAYWHSILSAVKAVGGAYVRWVKGE